MLNCFHHSSPAQFESGCYWRAASTKCRKGSAVVSPTAATPIPICSGLDGYNWKAWHWGEFRTHQRIRLLCAFFLLWLHWPPLPEPVVITSGQNGLTKNLVETRQPYFSPVINSTEVSPPTALQLNLVTLLMSKTGRIQMKKPAWTKPQSPLENQPLLWSSDPSCWTCGHCYSGLKRTRSPRRWALWASSTGSFNHWAIALLTVTKRPDDFSFRKH